MPCLPLLVFFAFVDENPVAVIEMANRDEETDWTGLDWTKKVHLMNQILIFDIATDSVCFLRQRLVSLSSSY